VSHFCAGTKAVPLNDRHMTAWILKIGARSIAQETDFFARIRLAVKLLRVWRAFGKTD